MKRSLFLSLLLLCIHSCKKSEIDPTSEGLLDLSATPVNDWLIPQAKVFDGGPGIDGIPSVDQPKFHNPGHNTHAYLSDDTRVLVYQNNNIVKAYPHPILDWHEIVNDQIGEDSIALTYCPLTGTGIGWGRIVNGTLTTFGVSGLLYESNLMPYDRSTNSTWSQMFNKCVNGALRNSAPEFFNFVEINFGTLKDLYPEAEVMTTDTGFDRDYTRYPYGNYLTSDHTLFPVTNIDDRLPSKEIIRVVIEEDEVIAYQYPDTGRQLILDTLQGKRIAVVGDPDKALLQSYYAALPRIDTPLNFTLEENPNSVVLFRDQLGNSWDMFGHAVSGPNKGAQLEIPYSYMAFWFSLHSFFSEVKIYGEE